MRCVVVGWMARSLRPRGDSHVAAARPADDGGDFRA